MHHAEASNKCAGSNSASLRPGNTVPFKEMLQRWRAVGNTVSDLTGRRFEPQTFRSRDERVTARPTCRFTRKPKTRYVANNSRVIGSFKLKKSRLLGLMKRKQGTVIPKNITLQLQNAIEN